MSGKTFKNLFINFSLIWGFNSAEMIWNQTKICYIIYSPDITTWNSCLKIINKIIKYWLFSKYNKYQISALENKLLKIHFKIYMVYKIVPLLQSLFTNMGTNKIGFLAVANIFFLNYENLTFKL